MKIIENNFKRQIFPREETCRHCNSVILLENEADCEYQPAGGDTGDSFDKVECYIWECPCCNTTNYIYP